MPSSKIEAAVGILCEGMLCHGLLLKKCNFIRTVYVIFSLLNNMFHNCWAVTASKLYFDSEFSVFFNRSAITI